jgi:tetraacyldisaccharide 4'-kinase
MHSSTACSSAPKKSAVPPALTQLWYGNARGAALLAPLASLYGGVTGLRRRAYETGLLARYGVGSPVVVVGNLTVGGTGKTPLVAWLARELQAQGYRVGIVSRGYGRRERAAQLVAAYASWEDVGDEPLLLAQNTGCVTAVGADRVAAARLLSVHGMNVIVSDDGLQHLRLAADCRIVVVDGERGFGNGRLLPAGPLREPLAQLRTADAVVVNGAAPAAVLPGNLPQLAAVLIEMQLVPGAACALAGNARRALESFAGAPLHAVAGIANPARFFRMLRSFGLEVIEHAFADHHPLVASDLEFGDDLPVLMTEKDAVKCRRLAAARRWYVPVAAHLSAAHAESLLARVVGRLKSYRR